jgi:malonyl-CoA O-methyltransferase
MHDIGDALLHAGFAEPIVDMDRVTVAYPSSAALSAELKDSGAVNIHPSRRRSLTGKQRFAGFRDALETFRNEERRIPLTYEVVYGHAWVVPEPGAATVSVSLKSLRSE